MAVKKVWNASVLTDFSQPFCLSLKGKAFFTVSSNGKIAMSRADLLHRMERLCREKKLFSHGAAIVIACSGGMDSIVLADLLRRLRESWQLRLCIAHFEHGIRGEESKEDAGFVKGLAEEWEIPFFLESGDVPAYAKAKQLSIETAARELRYEFLRNICNRLRYDGIALAHHADDQAETVLMRILRGTGLKGLSAMQFKSHDLIRPLLAFRKAELREYCAVHGLSFREDRTNAVPNVLRNRLRLELLPKLQKEYNPSVCEALCQLGEIASEEQEFLRLEQERIWPDLVRRREQPELSQEAFARLHPAMQRMVLQNYLQQVFGDVYDIGFLHYEALRSLLMRGETGARMELPKSRVLELSYGWLRPRMKSKKDFPPYPVRIPGCTVLVEYGMRIVTEIRSSMPEHTTPFEYYCDFDRLPETPVIRTRNQGDRITTAGGTKKLKELYIDEKIRREQRDSQPLLTSGNCLLWVIGYRRSILFRPDVDTKRILYARIEKEEETSHDEGQYPKDSFYGGTDTETCERNGRADCSGLS